METTRSRRILNAILGWGITFLMCFPVLWMSLAAFKTESDAVASPPVFIFQPTLDNFVNVLNRADYLSFLMNSVVVSLGSTAIGILIGLPAAYAFAFFPRKRTKDVLVWMLSTKMMPAVGVLVPMYIIFRNTHLLDTLTGLTIIYVLINLPIIIWMLFTFFREIPGEIVEAARLDGARPFQQFFFLLLPLAAPGIASTALLAIILSWNEAFWSINLTSWRAAPLPAFIASFSSPEGLFWAKLSAASLLAVGPIVAVGWLTQRHLVRGLTFGAVK